jgi:hypothetical protein
MPANADGGCAVKPDSYVQNTFRLATDGNPLIDSHGGQT